MPSDSERPIVVDFFSGAGGLSKGFEMAGFRTKLGIDNDKRVRETFLSNHPGAEFWLKDIRDVHARDLPDLDVPVGSPPCPEFSFAKKNRNPLKGMLLVNEYLRIIRELDEAGRLGFWVMENVVPAIPHYPKWIPKVRVLDAVNYGVPQYRKRAFAGDFPDPVITHARTERTTLDGRSLKRHVTIREAISARLAYHSDFEATSWKIIDDSPAPTLPDLKHDGYWVLDDSLYLDESQIQRMVALRSSKPPYQGAMDFPDHVDRPARTMTVSRGGTTREEIIIDENELLRAQVKRAKEVLRRLTPEECAVIQSFPSNFRFIGSKTSAYLMIGNAVPPLLAKAIAEAIKQSLPLGNPKKNSQPEIGAIE